MTITLAHHVSDAADAVRDANHATMRGPLTVPETYDVVGNLVELVTRLPQVLSFLGRSLSRTDSGEHFDDRGSDPGITLLGAHAGLVDALDDLDRFAGHLNHAHNHLGHLGLITPED